MARSLLLGTVKVDTPKDLHASSSSSCNIMPFCFVLKYAALIEYCLSHNVLTSNMDGDVLTAC